MKVKEIHLIGGKRLLLTVQCPSWKPFRTGDAPHLPEGVFQLFPDLTLDKCENDYGFTFEEECKDTEIPHLFEHLVMEIQGQVLSPRRELTGVTYWDWTVDPRGRFHVEVDYENEFVAIAAVRLAERLINAIDQRRAETIDLEWELDKLRSMVDILQKPRGGRLGPGARRSGPSLRRREAAPEIAAESVVDGTGNGAAITSETSNPRLAPARAPAA